MVVALLVLVLTGCQTAQQACEAEGGTYTQTGTTTITTLINTGKVLIPVTNTVPVYECEAADQ